MSTKRRLSWLSTTLQTKTELHCWHASRRFFNPFTIRPCSSLHGLGADGAHDGLWSTEILVPADFRPALSSTILVEKLTHQSDCHLSYRLRKARYFWLKQYNCIMQWRTTSNIQLRGCARLFSLHISWRDSSQCASSAYVLKSKSYITSLRCILEFFPFLRLLGYRTCLSYGVRSSVWLNFFHIFWGI